VRDSTYSPRGFHSPASFCASAIWAGVMRPHPHVATLAPMKREDARDLIRREWLRWRNEHLPLYPRPTGKDAMTFYDHLRRNQPDLLDFPFDGDRWLIVHGWLLSPGAVGD
jgi:hypothetical protein